jgi:hypothetical protein
MLASEITSRGAHLYELLEDEVELRVRLENCDVH